ncbi:MAG TPA: hypothetical protein VFJ09_02605, partial [Nocardioidaceae bacterium]|nr:hypothetical protein [Nocardioidaceae bacterium]
FASRTEAINRQIVEAIQGSGEVTDAAAEYDIEAIADEVLGGYDEGYLVKPEFGGLTGDPEADADAQALAERFWDVVRENAR